MSGENKENEQALTLRKELKTWEKEFANANGGRKPSRDDIKQDPNIGAKYSEYNKLIGRAPVRTQKVETPSKRRPSRPSTARENQTPQRERRSRNILSFTPQREAKIQFDVVQEELQEIQPTPAFIRSALGPTPQKDGMVLGIFDMATPSIPRTTTNTISHADQPPVDATPSKSASSVSSVFALTRTPQSSGKRHFLAAFASPSKRKFEDDAETPSTFKQHDATPSFLRRIPLPSIAEDGFEDAPGPFKKRGLVRSLSTIIEGLRKQEEERMDDEWDILDELEAEERGEKPKSAAPAILVENSQVAEMPLGPDEAPINSDDDGPAETAPLGRDGQPRKPWKKKGLKRQTRRVIMRPVLHKPGKEGSSTVPVEEDEVVAETQPKSKNSRDADQRNEDSNASDYEDVDEPASPARDKQVKQQQKIALKEQEHAAKKPGRKVNPLAHANFRKLKIKNKNSKANGRGRFGRR
ncbi:Hypothetical protein R9X50_00300100 [Acrodontium crateriforme]|uniref:DNA replication regulator SLD2 n=1 Tax=Acrodontium crateriforme TaxID=150365 RepID=A0AAQ3RBF8_9PEZI|nr:Hypothetical protein R9X50_00300100 [Acrodontium crateriforme]